MIINVQQTKSSSTAKEFTITGADYTYIGYTPGMHNTGSIGLAVNDINAPLLWTMKYQAPPFFQRLAIGAAFGRKLRQCEYVMLQNDIDMGLISQFRYDKVKTRYDVSLYGVTCQIYPLLQGGAEFMLVFYDGRQIAHLRRETVTRDLKDFYSIYLLDSASSFAVPLILFTLYYDHWEHGDREKFQKGSRHKSYGWSYGDAQELYDTSWLPRHFPQVEPESVEIDLEKSRKIGKRLAVAQIVLEILAIIILIGLAGIAVSLALTEPAKAVTLLVLCWLVRIFNNRVHYRK